MERLHYTFKIYFFILVFVNRNSIRVVQQPLERHMLLNFYKNILPMPTNITTYPLPSSFIIRRHRSVSIWLQYSFFYTPSGLIHVSLGKTYIKCSVKMKKKSKKSIPISVKIQLFKTFHFFPETIIVYVRKPVTIPIKTRECINWPYRNRFG